MEAHRAPMMNGACYAIAHPIIPRLAPPRDGHINVRFHIVRYLDYHAGHSYPRVDEFESRRNRHGNTHAQRDLPGHE